MSIRKFVYYLFCFLVTPYINSKNINTTKSLNVAEQKIIQKIKNYFQSLENVTIYFSQESTNTNQIAKGFITLRKPDHLYIRYISPHHDTFTLNHNMRLEYFDSELKEKTELPLPHVLDLFLFDNFDNVKITNIEIILDKINIYLEFDDTLAVLTFMKHPIKIISWRIEQIQSKTLVKLNKIVHNKK